MPVEFIILVSFLYFHTTYIITKYSYNKTKTIFKKIKKYVKKIYFYIYNVI